MLERYLSIKPNQPELICFVGAGGKTSSMFCLAQELVKNGQRVLVTTTTKIYQPKPQNCSQLVIGLESPPAIPGLTVWGQAVTSDHKLVGPSPEDIDRLFAARVFDHILVEADGAHGCPLKAPAEYEPVLPASVTKVVGVIGLSSLGQKANPLTVQRLSIWCQLTTAQPDDLVQESHLISLIKSPGGLFKDVPVGSSRCLLLNQADSTYRQQAAQRIIDQLLNDGYPLHAGVITDIQTGFIKNYVQRQFITGIILASGWSRRFPGNKLLTTYQGQPLVEWVIKAAVNSDLDEVVVVYQEPAVKEIAWRYGANPVCNQHPEYGQSEAVKLGLLKTNPDSAGVMFFTGDQPLVTPGLINLLISRFRDGDQLVIQPAYQGKPGSPVLFSSDLRTDLAGLTGDHGGRVIIGRLASHQVTTVEADNPDYGLDIDTIDDYRRLMQVRI